MAITGMAAAMTDAADAAGTTRAGHACLSDDRSGYDQAPAISANAAGDAWCVWLRRDPDDRERLCARGRTRGGQWAQPATIATGSFEQPSVACMTDGACVAVCVQIADGRWRLRAMRVDTGGPTSMTAPSSPGKAANPATAVSSDGSIWLAWEAWSKGRMLVCLSRWSLGRWTRAHIIAGSESGAYDPAIACDADGRAWVAWSGNDADHQRSIYLAAVAPDLKITTGPLCIARGGPLAGLCALNSHPSVACDPAGRIWVAWEHDGETSSRKRHPQTSNWIGRREVSAVCWDGSGLCEPPTGRTVFAEHNDHMPVLLSSPAAGLVALSRVSKGIAQPGPGLFEDRRTWDVRLSRLSPSGWSAPTTLLADEVGLPDMGRLHRPCAAMTDAGTMALVWQADTIQSPDVVQRQTPPCSWIMSLDLALHTDAAVGVGAAAAVRVVPSHSGAEANVNAPRYHVPRGSRRPVDTGGRRYTLIWGNCHEHTLLSRCWGDGSDATIDEDYRYGYDIEGYDFIAMTDHCFDSWEPIWRATRRAAAFYNDPPYVVANPAYEWTAMAKEIAPSSGHRNIVLASDFDARKMLDVDKVLAFDRPGRGNAIEDVWEHMRRHGVCGVTIPHHTADAGHTMNWAYHDPEFQTVVEIFQCRLSCEYRGCPRQTTNALARDGAWVWDALARGHRIGFVASGDHNSMGMGRTALLVREISQSGVVEALLSRRCYATTGAPMMIDFRVDGHIMGSEYPASGARPPVITARIEGTAPLVEVVVIRNCRIAHRVAGSALDGARAYALRWTDRECGQESAWYYVRAIQADDHIVWASPVWRDCVAGTGDRTDLLVAVGADAP